MTQFRRTYACCLFSLSLSLSLSPFPLLPLSRQRESTTMPPRLVFLNRPTRLEVWTLQKLMDLEIYCHARMRRETFPRYLFAVLLLPVSGLAACTGLLLSRTMTVEEANEVCEQRLAILTPKLTSYQEDFMKASLYPKLKPGLMHIPLTQSLPPL
jgi:hypothetical protein